MSAHWTELPVVVAGRRALDQALRQWKHYADEHRSLDHGRALGETGMLEDRMYESCKAAAEGLEAAAEERRLASVRCMEWVGALAESWEREADKTEAEANGDQWQHGAANAMRACAAALRAEMESAPTD